MKDKSLRVRDKNTERQIEKEGETEKQRNREIKTPRYNVTAGQKDGQIYRQRDSQTNRGRERETDRQRE